MRLERLAWCLSFTNLYIIKQCLKWLHLHQHYKINTDNLQHHFQLHKVLFSTRKNLLNFSMSLVLIRFRGSDLLVDSSFNSFICVPPSIDDKELAVGIWPPSIHNNVYKVQTTYIGKHSSNPFQTIIDNHNVSSLIA